MEPMGYANREEEALRAREAALAQRPQEAPLPAAVTWHVDCGWFWMAAIQYFELAQQLYQAGEYAQGDYAFARGQTYYQAALLCMHTNSPGIVPLLDAEPAEHDPQADPPSLERLQAKLEEVLQLQDPQTPPLPTVPAEAEEVGPCDGFYYIAWGHMLQASSAFSRGDTATGHYHIHLAQNYVVTWEQCEMGAHLP